MPMYSGQRKTLACSSSSDKAAERGCRASTQSSPKSGGGGPAQTTVNDKAARRM